MKMTNASKQALRDARHYNGGIIMLGKYHIECIRCDEDIQLVTLFVYDNNVLYPHQYNYERLVNRVLPLYYKTFSDLTDEVYSDHWMIRELDSIRRFSSVCVDGYFITVENRESNAYFRLIGKDELIRINEEWAKKYKSDHQEIREYLDRSNITLRKDPGTTVATLSHGTFKVERSLATHAMERLGGRLIKVKVIHSLGSSDIAGSPFLLHEKKKWGIRCLTVADTGIPEIDCLYPLGTTATSVVNGVFWFCDKEYWDHLWVDKHLMYKWSWTEDEPQPGEIPENTEIQVELMDDGKKKFYVMLKEEEYKLHKLQSVKVNKRMFMPCHISDDKGPFISGMLIDTLPEHDGIAAYMPQTAMDAWAHRLGVESKIKFAQLASLLLKGCARGLPDDVFTKEFGIPIGEGKVSAVILKQALKSDSQFLVNEHGEVIDKPVSFRSKKGICKNPKCEFYWAPIHPDYEECPSCKEPLTIVEWFSCGNEYAGIHKTDAQNFTFTGKLGSQIVKRVHLPKPSKINDSLIRELKWINKVARQMFHPYQEFKKSRICGDEVVTYTTNATKELLFMANVFPKEEYFYRGSIDLISLGFYPCHPRVFHKTREILAKAAITAKMERRVASGIIVDERTGKEYHPRYGFFFAAPGFGLKEDEVRIPEKCKDAVHQGLITIPRYPQREGQTDAPTLKVVGWSHGNVVENHPQTMKRQAGDYDGDGLSILPVWLTGKIVQRKIDDFPSKGSRDIESVQDVIDSIIKAAEGKTGIGPVDNKITEIAFEAICLGEPLTDIEAAWCGAKHQGSIQDIKHEKDEEAACPTARLEAWWKKPPDKNPVSQILFFDPSKKRAPADFYKFEVNHKDDQYAVVPEGKNNYYDWFIFLRNYGRYILNVWVKENPDLAYRVLNHPLLEVLQIFCKVDLDKFETPVLDFQKMYDEAIKELAQEEISFIKNKCPQHYKPVLALIDYVKEQGTKYSELANQYSQNRSTGDLDEIGWNRVKILIGQTRQKVASVIDYLVEHDIHLTEHLHCAVYCTAGLATSYKDKPIKTTWKFWVTELPVIRKMLAVQYRLHPHGLSAYYEQIADLVTNPDLT